MKKNKQYTSPGCEVLQDIYEDILCASGNGTTVDGFTDVTDYTWE